MPKFLIVEFIICQIANVAIFKPIFDIDFIHTFILTISQVVVTLLVRLIFNYITKKKQTK